MKRYFFLLVSLLVFPSCMLHAQSSAGSVLTGDWSGKLQAGPTALTIVIHLKQDAGGKMLSALDSPDQGAYDIPAEVLFISADSVSIRVPSLYASYRGRKQGDTISGTFKQGFQSFPLSLQPFVEHLNRPQTPQPPLPYQTEEVRFVNTDAGITLAGTLTWPVKEASSGKKKPPLVVLVSGSGLQDRDETLFEHKPFAVIADHLAHNGIASLRYDDRGMGQSEGINLKNTITPDFKSDAQAAVNAMRIKKAFSAIGVIGHSEGGDIAWMMAAEGVVDFAIGLSATAVKGDTALTCQVNRIASLSGKPATMNVDTYRRLIAQQANPWMQWFINYDPSKDLSAAKCPVFALYGENDCQVIATQNAPAAQQLLKGKKHSQVKIYPKLNHLFQHSTTGLPAEYRQIEQTIAEEVLNDITAWIKECTK